MSRPALQGMARDLGPRGITVSVAQPRPIDTNTDLADGPLDDLVHAAMAFKRHGRPVDVAGMVAGLAGPKAGFVTGAMHRIDGGFGA
ncbi:SDR family oxidoreductase [Dankookia rubra]|uniref:SDR family oxidoreductase n=1 Tax=Dankookia rubra TaxID=1442381 RepID=A0A4R5QCS9_9PROT|nr:SDR family oxidoreductase [Dankookia rubra]TDH60147.1 SDR family oxidoreductase [Dankookia rubra]